MSSICGVLHRTGRPVAAETIRAMTATLGHWQQSGDRSAVWLCPDGTVALGHVMLTNTPESCAEILPWHHAPSGLTITADARIDNREELCSQLAIPVEELPLMPDSGLILAAYRKWGTACAGRLLGDFAFVIWDEANRLLFCARDHLGVKPFYYLLADDSCVFATEMKGIFAVRDLSRELDEQWIADALAARIADNDYTPYRQIKRLSPAHWLTVSPAGVRKECYWQPDPQKEIHFRSEDQYVEAFREKLQQAVRCRMRSLFPIASELSGGLDSSTVSASAALLAETANLEFITFSHVPGDAYKPHAASCEDERGFQQLLRQHARIDRAFEISARDRGVLDALRSAQRLHDGPSHRVYGNLTDALLEAAAGTGARTLLSGFGGDEVVSHQAEEFLSELTEQRAWQELWRECRQTPETEKRSSVQALLQGMAGAYLPFAKPVWHSLKKKIAPPAEGLQERIPIAPSFYQIPAIRGRLDGFQNSQAMSSVRQSQCWRLLHPSLPMRLETCAIEAASNRLEYRYPLLDIRLVEFHLALPAHLKRKNGYGRYLFRKAMTGLVPPEVQWRVDKIGATVPSVRHRIIRDAAAIAELIQQAAATSAVHYVDLAQMSKRLERIVAFESGQEPPRLGLFLNALKLLLYFDTQRSGGGGDGTLK